MCKRNSPVHVIEAMRRLLVPCLLGLLFGSIGTFAQNQVDTAIIKPVGEASCQLSNRSGNRSYQSPTALPVLDF